MRNINAIYRKEIQSYFNSPMAYIFLLVFAALNGFFFTNTFFIIGESDLRGLFGQIPMFFLAFIPAITMGLIAKERYGGTMEIITTLPIKDHEFVIGKYLSALTLIFVGLMFTSVHFFTLIKFGTDIDYGALFCGYFGLTLVAAFYTSIGLFASSITENQVIAFIIAVAVVFTFYLMDKVLIFIPSAFAGFFQYLSVDFHFSNIARGVIDSRNLIYFLSLIFVFLNLSVRVLETRKWR